MDLTPKMADALRQACERDDGKMFQGWMSDDEWTTLEHDGYMQKRRSATDTERARWIERFDDHLRDARLALSLDKWQDALRHLTSVEGLWNEIQAEWWCVTDAGRKAVGEGPVIWRCHNVRHLHTTRQARNQCTHWGPRISDDHHG
jgi:hypothetical protein